MLDVGCSVSLSIMWRMLRRILPLAVALFAAMAACTLDAAGEGFMGELSLVRYDMPRGRSDGFAPTRQTAVRVDGADAVDWPEMTLNGKALWREGGEARVELRLRRGRRRGGTSRWRGMM